jgi:hypothetical protein
MPRRVIDGSLVIVFSLRIFSLPHFSYPVRGSRDQMGLGSRRERRVGKARAALLCAPYRTTACG